MYCDARRRQVEMGNSRSVNQEDQVMKKLLIVAVVGMVLAIAACGPGAEPTPTPTSTPAVVATPIPTATATPGVVATPTPTTKPLATPTPTPGVVATPTPTAAPLATPTATPKRGGIFKARSNVPATKFNPTQTTAATIMFPPAYNNLVAQDPRDPTSEKIVPDLADRWEISGDGLTYTFFLYKGIKWHDGVPFTAADVKYTLDLTRNPPKGFTSPRQSYFAAIASVEAPDDYTVVIKLSRVSNTIMGALAELTTSIVPKHLLEKDLKALDNTMVGTGPYLFKKLTPEGIVIEERNPSYWNSGLPYLDSLQFIPIIDSNAFIAALYTGQIDALAGSGGLLVKTEVQRIQKDHPELLSVKSIATMNFMFLGFNTKTPPFTDQRVRVAMQDSLDRVELQRTGSYLGQVGGWEIPGTYWTMPPEELAKLPGYGPDISARRAQARQLLKDAGIAAGTEFTIACKSNKAGHVDEVELMQLQWQQALPDIKVKIRCYPSAELDTLTKGIAPGEIMGVQSWIENISSIGPDPDLLGPYYITGGSQNFTRMSDPRIDELQLKQSSMLDPAQRRLVVWEMDKLVIQNASLVPLQWSVMTCPTQPYVRELLCAASQNGITNRYEIVWLDK